MPILALNNRTHWHFDMDAAKSAGKDLRETYAKADPFPHICLDNVFDPAVLDMCLAEFPAETGVDSESFERDQENLKASFNPEYVGPGARSFFYALNSRPFLAFLENMTGIKGLIPDPYYIGGGFHRTLNGGHLSVHADFNYHPILGLERRINALVYLNRDWKPDYGGQLELWDRKMERRVQSIDPLFNRLVVFNTDSDSFHGQPDPIRHPAGLPRRSIALYYYTATWDGTRRKHTTQFKARPASTDKPDYKVRLAETVQDFTPPILLRTLKKLRGKKPAAE